MSALSDALDRIKRLIKRAPTRMMGINPCERKVHDPWGHKNGNRFGSIIRWQYQVAQSELEYFSKTSVNHGLYKFDKPRLLEHNFGRFVRTNRRVEKLRR